MQSVGSEQINQTSGSQPGFTLESLKVPRSRPYPRPIKTFVGWDLNISIF